MAMCIILGNGCLQQKVYVVNTLVLKELMKTRVDYGIVIMNWAMLTTGNGKLYQPKVGRLSWQLAAKINEHKPRKVLPM